MLQRIGRLAAQQGVAAYAVGGCVRDWLLGNDTTVDLDVVVEGDGLAFAQALGRVLRAGVTRHEQFRTATLTWRRVGVAAARIDIATCRKETYAKPAAYPKVVPGALRDDLFRRDFTINAMAVAVNPSRFGRLLDPFGGRRDLAARRLRILHAGSFVDDPSRILRAVRFLQRFGFRLEAGTARALTQAIAQGGLERLNYGRLRKELDRMCQEPDPGACLRRLDRWLSTRASSAA